MSWTFGHGEGGVEGGLGKEYPEYARGGGGVAPPPPPHSDIRLLKIFILSFANKFTLILGDLIEKALSYEKGKHQIDKNKS